MHGHLPIDLLSSLSHEYIATDTCHMSFLFQRLCVSTHSLSQLGSLDRPITGHSLGVTEERDLLNYIQCCMYLGGSIIQL